MKARTILIDPPWPEKRTGSLLGDRKFRSAEQVFPQMTILELADLPINELADTGAHLWLWSTDKMLPHAFYLMETWGFKYHAPVVWRKKSGNGNYFIHRTEFILFGYNKKCQFNRARYIPNDYDWPRPKKSEHSTKPEGSYQLIESVSDEPRIELFARNKRKDWLVLGNEIDQKDIRIALQELT